MCRNVAYANCEGHFFARVLFVKELQSEESPSGRQWLSAVIKVKIMSATNSLVSIPTDIESYVA